MTDSPDAKPPIERIEEALREIGVLLVALAPLDAAFDSAPGSTLTDLLLFLTAGATLFVIALLLERRRRDVKS